MPRYFFRLSSSDLVPEDGEELPNRKAAAEEAKAVARDMAKNQRLSKIEGKSVIVSDKTGAVVFRAPLPMPRRA
jgi:hypothetical protein